VTVPEYGIPAVEANSNELTGNVAFGNPLVCADVSFVVVVVEPVTTSNEP